MPGNELSEVAPQGACRSESATANRRGEMNALIDDISRVIASPISRRRAFKMVSGAVGGALLTSLGLGRAARALGAQASSDSPCPHNGVKCNGQCYPAGYSCCSTVVCTNVQQCCTNHCCGNNQSCCGSGCCNFGSTCCGNNTCCSYGVACCNGKCCTSPGAICCGGTCCPEGYLCCANQCVKSRPSHSTICIPV